VLRLSLLQVRVATLLIVALGFALTAIWVLGERGPYPLFLALELGEGPDTHPLAAAGLTFIVVMVPALAVILGIMAFSPLRVQFNRHEIARARAEFREAMEGKGAHAESQRGARYFGVAASGGIVGAGIRAGWFEALFGDPGSLAAAVVVSLSFGLVAGLLHGRTARGRIGFVVAFCVVALGSLPAVAWYLERRPEPLTFELLLPIFVGGIPGAILFFVIARWIEPPPPARR